MFEIDKLVNELSSHYPKIKSKIETKIRIIAIQLGKKKFDELFLGNHQETQDCTKLFQFVVNSAIEELCREKNIPLYQKEIDGADWVWVDKDDNEILLEQKVRTFLGRSKNFYKNIKKYGLPCTSWTGNKSSVFNKKKVDYHLLWSFEIIGNKIGRGGGEVLSLSENGSVWKTGNGKKDSYATLTMTNNNKGIHLIQGSLHPTIKSTYLLLEN